MMTVYVVQMWYANEGAKTDTVWSSRGKAEARVAALIEADPYYERYYERFKAYNEWQILEWEVDPEDADDPANALT